MGGARATNHEIYEGTRAKGWYASPKRLEQFHNNLDRIIDRRSLTGLRYTPEEMTEINTEACDATFAKKNNTIHKTGVYWWEDQIGDIKKECNKTRRRLTRHTGKRRRPDNNTPEHNTEEERLTAAYKEQKKKLNAAILKAKEKAWAKICKEIDNDVWGRGYKIATGKLFKAPRKDLTKQAKLEIAMELFPAGPSPTPRTSIDNQAVDIPTLSEEEVREAALRMKTKKAPGPDYIPPEVVQAMAIRHTEYVTKVLNNTVQRMEFPEAWKEAKLALIEKGKKANTQETQYRPICLISSAGKLLEQVINRRINLEMAGTRFDINE